VNILTSIIRGVRSLAIRFIVALMSIFRLHNEAPKPLPQTRQYRRMMARKLANHYTRNLQMPRKWRRQRARFLAKQLFLQSKPGNVVIN
jgi:hypothetical protein